MKKKNSFKYAPIVEQKKTKPLITKPRVESSINSKFNTKISSNSWFEINNIDIHDYQQKDSFSSTLKKFEKRSL